MTERMREAKSDSSLISQALKDPLGAKRSAEVILQTNISIIIIITLVSHAQFFQEDQSCSSP